MTITRWMPGLPAAALALGLVATAITTATPMAPSVVASIAPVHSLVAAVMQGVGEPRLLVPGGSSPHAYALRPSDARAIESASLLVWVGPGLESFLERPIASLVRGGEVLRLVDTPGLRLLPLRDATGRGGDQPGPEHHAHGHRHDDDPRSEQGSSGTVARIDMHLWLDPENAWLM